MALPMLVGGADCGPINPLQGLSKNFDQDRGIQQAGTLMFSQPMSNSSSSHYRINSQAVLGLPERCAYQRTYQFPSIVDPPNLRLSERSSPRDRPTTMQPSSSQATALALRPLTCPGCTPLYRPIYPNPHCLFNLHTPPPRQHGQRIS